MESPLVLYQDTSSCSDDFRPSTHLSPESEVAILRALLRWGEGKCLKSYENLKNMNLPLVNQFISATETAVGRIGLQRWLDSLVAYCDPLTASIDKYLAQHLLSTLAFALDHPRESENKAVLEQRVRDLELQLDDFHAKYLREMRAKEQLQHEIQGARIMHRESAISARTTIDRLEDELGRAQTISQENALRAWSRISALEEEVAALKPSEDSNTAPVDDDSDRIHDLEWELAVANTQREQLETENAALKGKLKQTEQKLMWSMLVMSVRRKGASSYNMA
ncbi:Aste57867_15273 [Aphanomyces stellatus]|uniref:Aste57867_15273 protein n=1 Tax=Aphanomyces stellatus TaxID=120398 RepID=A0A485L425_9STRA|nr:hypothetical protein As57867_015217 [Aphanomyces stellatus]VFT92082.1 Aste57867_15273 [Aphanomyces stellatus]